MVLDAAVSADLAVQRKAVALVKNVMFMNKQHTAAVTHQVLLLISNPYVAFTNE